MPGQSAQGAKQPMSGNRSTPGALVIEAATKHTLHATSPSAHRRLVQATTPANMQRLKSGSETANELYATSVG
jgi:hypothetical protein